MRTGEEPPPLSRVVRMTCDGRGDPGWAARSADALDAASRAGRLTVPDVVWAEMAGRFASPAAVAALSTLGIEFDPVTAPAAADAGRLWRVLRDAGGRAPRPGPSFSIFGCRCSRAKAAQRT